jgi:acyl carrier protein
LLDARVLERERSRMTTDRDRFLPRIADVLARVVESDDGEASASRAQPAQDASLHDLGVTSLLLFRFISELEDEFQFQVGDEDLVPPRFETIGTVCELLDSYRVRDLLGTTA